MGLSARLRREVESFVQLLQAESGALGVHPRPIALTELLSELEEVFAEHAAATGKRLVLPVGVAEETIASDPRCWRGS